MRTNVIYRGDCEQVLANPAGIPDESVDLVYADPPFFTNRTYEQIWKNPDGTPDQYEVRSFKDRWAGGVENFISWLEPRIRQAHRVLKPTGTLYLHCDWHANAHIRIMLDRVFGSSQFANEIAWCYSGGGIPKHDFPRKHDTIFRYLKGDDCTFNVEYRAYSKDVAGTHSTGEKLDLERGTPITDWWTDLPFVNPWTKKGDVKLGYPTQKPEALLARIVRISSNPDDLVLDPFCGCGTAIAAAQNLGRKWVGVDISPNACRVMKKRIDELLAVTGKAVEILGMPKTLSDLRKMTHYEFQQWGVETLHALPSTKFSGDMGIDGRTVHGDAVVQVKQQDHIGRNVIDNFVAAMNREKKTTGYVVGYSFGRGAVEEVARLRNLKNGENRDIRLKKAEDLLAEE